MQISTPPKLKAFYQRWEGTSRKLKPFSYFGQFVSGMTESLPIFAVLHTSLKDIFGNTNTVFYSALITTIIAVVLLEMTLRVKLKQSFYFLWEKINPKGKCKDLTQEVKAAGLGKLDAHLRFATVFFAVILFAIQQGISWFGSFETIEYLTPPPQVVNEQAVKDSILEQSTAQANKAWQMDSTILVGQFDRQITAAEGEHLASAEAHTITADKYELIDPVRYSNRISNERARAARDRSKAARLVLELESIKADSVDAAYQRYKAGLSKANELALLAYESTVTANEEKEDDRAETVNGYGVKLAWLTVFGSILLLVALYFETGIKHGSQSKELYKDSPLRYYPNWLSSWWRARKERFLYKRHAKVFDYEKASPNPPLPFEIAALVDFSGTIQDPNRSDLRLSTQEKDFDIFELPVKSAIKEQQAGARRIGFGDQGQTDRTYTIDNRNEGPIIRNEGATSRNEANANVTGRPENASIDKVCACGCGRSLRGKRNDAVYFNNACRARDGRRKRGDK